jgi:iron complex transport system substrate-binding protein
VIYNWLKPMKRNFNLSFPWLLVLLSVFLSGIFGALLKKDNVVTPIGNNVQRVVSLTPNVTEIIFSIKAEDSLVGISDYCTPPDKFNNLPRCGGLLNPNFERILALHPTIIFLLGQMDRMTQFSQTNRIKPVSVYIDSFGDLVRETENVGKLLNKSDAAIKLISDLKLRLENIRKSSAQIPRLRCLILIGREEGSLRRLSAIGGSSYISEMLEIAGGENIFASQKQGYFYASLESIQALQPEVIFDLRPNMPLTQLEKESIQKDWDVVENLPAVQKKRIVVANENFYTVPGPRMPEIAEAFQTYLKELSSIQMARSP